MPKMVDVSKMLQPQDLMKSDSVKRDSYSAAQRMYLASPASPVVMCSGFTHDLSLQVLMTKLPGSGSPMKCL